MIRNYSSRNSLRSAPFLNNNSQTVGTSSHKIPMTMPQYGRTEDDKRPVLQRGVEKTSNYSVIDSDCFLVQWKKDLVCLLCARREMMRRNTISHHLASEEHNLSYNELFDIAVGELPDSTSLVSHTIRELLLDWYNTNSLRREEIDYRTCIVEVFTTLLRIVDPDSHCRVIGSFAIGNSTITSDINLEIVHPNNEIFIKDPRAKNSIHHQLIDQSAPLGQQFNRHTLYYDLIPNAVSTLLHVMNKILNDHGYSNIFQVLSNFDDLNAKSPKLRLKHIDSDRILDISCYTESVHKICVLLELYLSLDDRARIIAILVRHWTKLCNIDVPDHGTYPPYVYVILIIYYLQRTHPPVLPCLHESSSKPNSSHNLNVSQQVATLNKLKELQLDPTNNSLDTSQESCHNGSETETKVENMVETYDNELEDEAEEEDVYTQIDHEAIKNMNWKSENQWDVHQLFIGFLKEMVGEFNDTSTVISIRSIQRVDVNVKKWNTSIKAIENPVKPMVNMSKSVGSRRSFEYIRKCFKQAFCYLTSIPIDAMSLRPKTECPAQPEDFIRLFVHERRLRDYFCMREPAIRGWPTYRPINELARQRLFAKDVDVINTLFDKFQGKSELDRLPSVLAKNYYISLLRPGDYSSAIFCWLCREAGHSKDNCFRGKIDNLTNELQTYDHDLDMVSNFDYMFFDMYNRDTIPESMSKKYEIVLADLTKVINRKTKLNCKLELFGSTINKLGSIDSDLDVCMTLIGNDTGKGLNFVDILDRVSRVFKDHERFYPRFKEVEAVLSARVPIIKFLYDDLKVDLSMYNQCGKQNSRLLRRYASLDERVPQLVSLVKRYAKACGIADASKGTLSSYTWSILVIHYLQNTSPPILPVLQESTTGDEPMIGVAGWNVWFDETSPWPNSDQVNTLGLTQLFKGFFAYFGTFEFNLYVVTIRKSVPITRFQKNWNNCMIAIEDPFELTYNLACRLDDQMSIYVINSFSQTYRHLVAIQRQLCLSPNSQTVETLTRMIFDGKQITGCLPPYRGCSFCGRLAHRVKSCPDRRRRQDNKNVNHNIVGRNNTNRRNLTR